MTKRDFDSKLSLTEQYLNQALKFSRLKLKDLQDNSERRLAVERALFLAAQSAIDLAEAYCVAKKFRRPSSMHESFDILRENEVISDKHCANLLKMVGFRNVLTHGYTKIDYSKVSAVLKSGLKDIRLLLNELGK